MAQYFFKARDTQGLPIDGFFEALNDIAVLKNLKQLGYHVIHIRKQSSAKLQLLNWIKKIRGVSQQELIHFTRQLSTMLKAGLPITTALDSISKQVKNEDFKKAITSVLIDIQSGASLSESLSRHERIFNLLYINMVKVGESAGILDQVLERLAALNAQELEARIRIRAALIYPTILVAAAIIIVNILLIFIIPKFINVFETYEAQIPLATRILLYVSAFIKKFWMLVILSFFAGGYYLKKFLNTKEGRYKFHKFLFRIPVVGEFYLKVLVSRFTRTLGVLVKSGVPILEALTVSERTVNNVVLSRVIHGIRVAVAEGQSLTQPLASSGMFPQMVVQMVAAGEKSGKLDQMLVDVADYYDQETDYAIKNATATLEPALLLVMGVIVAFIALAVLLPVFNMIKVFRGGI